MSCFPEATYSIYVDGELAADESRLLESHLVTCRECRVLVSALRDESSLLSDVLHEREAPRPRTVAATAPDPGFALGLPLAVAAVTAAFAVVSFLIQWRWPSGLSQLQPLRLKGAFEMAIDVVLLLREQVPGLAELALALGGVAAVSTLLSLAVGALYQRLGNGSSLLIVLACLLTAAPEPASALDLRRGVKEVTIATGETVRETLVVSAETVDIDGTVDGDLVVGAERLTIRGTVRGDVYAFVRDLEVSGTVTGGVHSGAGRIYLDGSVGRSVYVGTDDFTLTSDGRIGRDVFLWGDKVTFDGTVERDVAFIGDSLELRGPVGRDVDVLRADRLTLRAGARVGGDVTAALTADEIEMAPGAVVAGTAVRTALDTPADHYWAAYLDPGFYLFLLVRLAAAFVFGMLLYVAVPQLFPSALPDGRSFFRSLGVGFLLIVVTPIAIVCCALTVIGIPVAVLGAFAFAVTVYSANIAVGALIGRSLLHPGERLGSFGPALLAGLFVLSVATHVPLIGLPIGVVSLLFGLGVVYAQVRARWDAVGGA